MYVDKVVEHFYRQRRFNEAWSKAVVGAGDASDPSRQSNGYLSLGRICYEFGQYREAGSLLRNAVDILRSQADDSIGPESHQFHASADYAAILILKCAMSEPDQSVHVTAADLKTASAKSSFDLIASDFMARDVYDNLQAKLVFAESSSSELLIEQLRAHRRAIRSARSLHDAAMYDKAREMARNFYDQVDAALVVPIADETSSQVGPLGGRFSRYMNIVPFRTTYEYLRAGFEYDCGEVRRSLELFQQFLRGEEANGHVAARIGLVRVARELGHDVTALCAEYDAQLAAEEFSGTSLSGKRVEFLHVERALLKWTLASYVSTHQPARALRICDEADQIIGSYFEGRPASNYDLVPKQQSYGAIGYHLLRGHEGEALRLAKSFLRDWHLADLVKFLDFRSIDSPGSRTIEGSPSADLKHELVRAVVSLPRAASFPFVCRSRTHAGLLAIPDMLAAIGRLPEALGWLEAILHSVVTEIDGRQTVDGQMSQAPLGSSLPHAESDRSLARWMSLLNMIGLHEMAGRLPEVMGQPQRWSVEIKREVALSYLGAWKFAPAEQAFKKLMAVEREEVAIWGLNGLADGSRRDPRDAISQTDRWVAKFTEHRGGDDSLSLAAQATIVIAKGWVELQHGDPERASRAFVDGLGFAPHDVGGWIGMVRALRVLGRHKEAIGLLDWLREPDQTSTHTALLPSLAKGSKSDLADIARGVYVRYSDLLEVERGWCYIDIDEFELARESFEIATRRSPYIMSGQRGRLAAMAWLKPNQVDEVLNEILADAERWVAEANLEGEQLLRRLHDDLLIEGGRLMSRLGNCDKADELFEQFQRRRASLGRGGVSRTSQLRILRIAEAHLDANRLAEAERSLAAFDETERLIVERAEAKDQPQRPTFTLKPSSGTDRVVRLFRVRWLLANQSFECALRETDNLIAEASGAEEAKGLGPNEHLAVAKLILLFEHRKYRQVLDLANEKEPGRRVVFGSDIRRLIAAWSALALAELESPGSDARRRHVAEASTRLKESDRTSVDEIHLGAILRALRNGPIGRLRPSDPIRPIMSRPVVAEITTAIGELDGALRRRPYSGAIRRDKAALLIALGRLEDASAELERARQTVSSDARIDLLTGVIAYKRGEFERSISWFRQAVDLDPRDPVHHRALAVAYFANEQPREALAIINNGLQSVELGPQAAHRQLEATAIQLVALHIRQMKPRDRASHLRQLLTPELKTILRSGRHDEIRSDRDADTAAALAEIEDVVGEVPSAWRRRRAVRGWNPDHPGLATAKAPAFGRQFDLDAWRNRFGWLFLSSIASVVGILVANAARAELPDWAEAVAVNLANETRTFVLLGPVAFGVAFLVALFEQRFTSLRVGNVFEATLEAGDPVPEIVHVDLDMSVSRLLVVSGFSHFRPEVRNYFYDDRSLFGQ